MALDPRLFPVDPIWRTLPSFNTATQQAFQFAPQWVSPQLALPSGPTLIPMGAIRQPLPNWSGISGMIRPNVGSIPSGVTADIGNLYRAPTWVAQEALPAASNPIVMGGPAAPAPRYLPATLPSPPPAAPPSPPNSLLSELRPQRLYSGPGSMAGEVGTEAEASLASRLAPRVGSIPRGVTASTFSDLAPSAAAMAPEAAAAAEGGLMSRLPGFAQKGLSGAWKGVKGFGIGQGLNFGGHLIGERLLGDNMSNNSDPTDWKQAYVRGMAGGGTLGGYTGPQGAMLGAVGGGIGNAAGFILNDLVNGDAPGDSHLGNVPLIGAAFGGGSGKRANDIKDNFGVDVGDLSFEKVVKKLDSYNFAPDVRKAVADQYNTLVADAQKNGVALPEAAAAAYKTVFLGGQGAEGKAIPPVVDQAKAAVEQAGQQPQVTQPAVDEMHRKSLAMQALIAQIAPQIFQTNQAPDMSLYNGLMNDSIANLPASAQAWAQKSQADANARAAQSHNDTVGLLAVLPSLLTQQVASSYHDQAVQDAIALRRAEIAAQSQGSNGGQDLTSLGG